MALKIKWNDDRVHGTITALLLITRANLLRGETTDLVAQALAAYRDDPDAYKAGHPKRDRAAARETAPLTNARQIAFYQKLNADVDRLAAKMEKNHRQFSSIEELDNYLVFNLDGPPRPPEVAGARR